MENRTVNKAFIIHGAYGSPTGNWFPWLKKRLEADGLEVHAPQFPIGEKQSLKNWNKEFLKYFELVDANTIMIGHSIGCAFALNILEQIDTKAHAAFLVVPFVENLGDPTYDGVNRTFYEKVNWTKAKAHCKSIYVYCSDNDPYVSPEKSRFVASMLGAKTKIIPNGGHLNAEFGFTAFPELATDIEAIL